MPQRRYIVSILFDFGIFAPFALSPSWIFSALRCTSRASLCSRLKQSLTFRSVPCCLDSCKPWVALKSASPADSETATDALTRLFFLSIPRAQVASPPCQTIFYSSNHRSNPQTFPRLQAPPDEGAATFAPAELWVMWSEFQTVISSFFFSPLLLMHALWQGLICMREVTVCVFAHQGSQSGSRVEALYEFFLPPGLKEEGILQSDSPSHNKRMVNKL